MEGILAMLINIFLLGHELTGLFSLFGITLGGNRLAQFALCTFVSGGKPCPGGEERRSFCSEWLCSGGQFATAPLSWIVFFSIFLDFFLVPVFLDLSW